MKKIIIYLFLVSLMPICFMSCGSDDTPITQITLSTSSIENAEIGSEHTITAKITPTTGATNTGVVWSHINNDVLSLTSDGYNAVVKILAHGNDSIICRTAEDNGVKATCIVKYVEEVVPDTTETDTIE